MVNAAPILRGLNGERPTIVERSDEDFIAGLLADLSGPEGREKVASEAMLPGPGQPLSLYQPIHRVFHLVVVELCCSQFGEPRLDRRRIESAGLVVRRINQQPPSEMLKRIAAGEGSSLAVEELRSGPFALSRYSPLLEPVLDLQGWMQTGSTFVGWQPLLTAEAESQDPEPARRMHQSGLHPSLNALLFPAVNGSLTERVSPLFIAPPEVTQATGRTLLYALVPVVSPEISDRPVRMVPFSDHEMNQFLHPYLQTGNSLSVPRPNQTLYYQHADQSRLNDLSDFIAFVRQVAVELDAFGDSPESQKLYALLNELELPFQDWAIVANDPRFTSSPSQIFFRPAGEFLSDAAAVLLARDQSMNLVMPMCWAYVSDDQATAIRTAAQQVLAKQVQILAPRQGRFDEPGSEYVLRAFVRVRRGDDCPPKLVWSEYSLPYTIRPWFAPSPAPPPLVQLPDIDADFLRNVKPNVAFVVPPGLAGILSNPPAAFLSGSAGAGVKMALDMICGFNIPIITICAFIVLNIFLALFNIIFRWIMFVKICMPFPRRSAG